MRQSKSATTKEVVAHSEFNAYIKMCVLFCICVKKKLKGAKRGERETCGESHKRRVAHKQPQILFSRSIYGLIISVKQTVKWAYCVCTVGNAEHSFNIILLVCFSFILAFAFSSYFAWPLFPIFLTLFCLLPFHFNNSCNFSILFSTM